MKETAMSLQNLTRRGALGLMAVALPTRVWGKTTARAWAEPIDLAGVPNLHRVTPLIYRSAQPSAEGFHNLAKIGVKTVINLRRTVDDSPLAVGTGLALIHIKITTRHVTDENGAKIALALRALRDAKSTGPVLLHCTHGADRTGMIAALWRMLYQGWSRDQALEELQQGGFGFHAVWINIPQYLRHVDLNDLKTRIASEPA
jgi:protein tyrosine/serine phosphatase